MVSIHSASYTGDTIEYLMDKAAKYIKDYSTSYSVLNSSINIYSLEDNIYKLTIGVVVRLKDDN